MGSIPTAPTILSSDSVSCAPVIGTVKRGRERTSQDDHFIRLWVFSVDRPDVRTTMLQSGRLISGV